MNCGRSIIIIGTGDRMMALPIRGSFIGLTGYGPNINLMRDPRWGRNSEVHFEEPTLSGLFGTNMVRGMQEGTDPKYLKMISGLKQHRESFIPTISKSDAAAKALNAGTDVELGDTYFSPREYGGNGGLTDALEANMTSYAQVDTALRRLLSVRFKAGLFDPLEVQPYTDIPITVVNSTEHHDFIFEATQQALVLLKNEKENLPLKKGMNLAVIAPHASS